MQIIVWCLSVLAFFIFIILFGIQFYKIGVRLKEKYVIFYRLYIVLWILISALIVSASILFLQDSVDQKNRDENSKKLALILKMDDTIIINGQTMTVKEATEKTLHDALKNGHTYEDVYKHAKTSKTFSNKIKLAQEAGFSDSQIKNAMFYE